MAQPSSIQVLGGPLGGQRLEFHGGDVVVGSAPDCAVRIDSPGVEPHHARIVIDITGATIYAVDGVLGVNDDLVSGDSLLRSGDFIWLGEPAGADSLMLQFTLGDVDEAGDTPGMAAAPVEAMAVDEVVSEETAAPGETPQTLEEVAEPVLMEEAESAPLEMSAQETEGLQEAPEAAEAPMEVQETLLEPAESEPLVAEAPEAAPVEPLVETPAEEPLVAEAPALETAEEVAPADLEPVGEPASLTPSEEPAPLAAESPSSPAVEAPKVVPPAPWETSGSSTPEPPAQAEYASAWESPAAPPAPEPPPVEPAEETVLTKAPAPPPPPPPPPPAAPRPPRQVTGPKPGTVPPAPRRPGSAPAPRVKTDASPRMPKPAPASSNAPMIVGGLAALLIVAGGGYWLTRPAAPVTPAPTPRPTPVAVSTPPPAPPETTPLGTETAALEPTPEAAVASVPDSAPTPQVAATPAPRATPPPRATPTPAPTRAAAAPPATPAPVAAATVAAPASQAPRLLDEANAAVAANDLAGASQLLDQVLRLEPGNREATTRKAEVAARLASLNRRFSIGTTTVLGGKTSRGPTGFDLGGGGVVQTEFSAQIRCTTTPASVEAGMNYSVRCSILNIGDKAFRLASVAVTETTDGAKTAGAGTPPRGDVAPQSDQSILERSGTWAAKSAWSIEVVAKSTKDESFRAVYTWR